MIAQEFEYTAPTQLEEVLTMIAAGAKPLAGGMSLIPMMKLRLATPEKLVDLGRLEELKYIRQQDDEILIGATTTHYEVETSQVLRRSCPLLPKTAVHIGDVQVRHMGTVGGSVAHADPAADYPAALAALEAKVRLASAGAERILSITEFLLDPFTTALEPGEIVREIIVPVEDPASGTAYVKMEQAASGFAIVGVAARVRRSAGKITMARIGITGVGPIAYRAVGVEQRLEGSAGSRDDISAAAASAAEGVEASSDLHASAEYRTHLARLFTARAISAALAELV
jgi:carbon-monoxide dehydrogenase medium subunit